MADRLAALGGALRIRWQAPARQNSSSVRVGGDPGGSGPARPRSPGPSASRPGAHRRSSAAGSPLPAPRPLHRAPGGRLGLAASSGDRTFTVATTEAA